MKSKVNVVIMAIGLGVIAASEADVVPQALPAQAALVTASASTDSGSHVSPELLQQANQYAVIQPCYRWPHPCD